MEAKAGGLQLELDSSELNIKLLDEQLTICFKNLKSSIVIEQLSK